MKIYLNITICNQTYRTLLDTGSTMSILNSRKVDCTPFKSLGKVKMNLQTINNATTEYVERIATPTPIQFRMDANAAIRWYKRDLGEKEYDILMGMDLLKNIVKTIDFVNKKVILINNVALDIYSEKSNTVDCFELSQERTINLDHLNLEEREGLQKILSEYQNLIYKDGDQLTNTHSVTHEIRTNTDQQIHAKLYRLPPKHEEEVRKQVDEMERQGIVRKSNSRYASPIVVVPKKLDSSGIQKFRICVDYRKLNEITIEDRYPLPNIEGILDKLGRAQYFTTLDLAKGYHQIKMHPRDIHKTAFITPNGLYEYLRMPFGLKNAPATFQRVMNEVLREHINKRCVVYLDDILIFSTSLQEHLVSIKKIFQKLSEHNLKVQIDKMFIPKKGHRILRTCVNFPGNKAQLEQN